MALPPKKEHKLTGRKAKRQAPYQAAHSLDDCVSATISGLSVGREVGLDDAPKAAFGRLTSKAELGRPESDLDHVSSGFSTYLPSGKKREQRLRAQMVAQCLRAQMVAQGYAPTAQDSDWDEPESQDPRAQSLAALYDAYGEDDAALEAAYDAYGAKEDEPEVAPRRASRKAERQAQTLRGLKTMGSLLAEPAVATVPAVSAEPEALVEEAPAEPERTAAAPVSFAEHDALEDEALRDLLGPAYDAAVGASTLLDSSAPKPAPPEAPESDEALRDLLGPAYDAAIGESTLLDSSAPKPAPPEAPESDEALRDLLGPAYDAAVGESTLLDSSVPKPAPPEAPEANEDEALRALLGPAYDAAVGESTLLDSSAPKPAPPEANDDEAMRALLGPAYDAAVGESTLLDSSVPKPAPPEAPEANEDEALRALLGPAYDAAVGESTLLDSSAPKPAPSETPSRNEDEALRDLLGPAYDAAVGASPALAPMPRSDTPAPQTARALQAAPTSSLAPVVPQAVPPKLDAWVPPSPPEELSAAYWVPPPLPDEAYAAYDAPPWAGDEPPLPDEVPALAPAESWDAPWSHERALEPQTLAPTWSQVGAGRGSSRRAGAIQARPLACGARGRTAPSQGTTPPRATPPRAMRAHGRSAVAAPEASVPYVKDLDEVSSSVGLHPYDPEALAGRRGRRGPEVKDLEGSASTVSMPYEQALSGYSVELDATGAGAAESAPRGKRRGSQYRRVRQAPSLEESASSVTLPLGAQSDELSEEPAATKRRSSRYSRRPQAAQVSSLDELSSSVTLPLGACPVEPDAPETNDSAVDASVSTGAQEAAGSDEVTLAYNEMIRLLTAREYSAYELTRKCTGRFAPTAVAAALARCQEQGFQSDERYADLLVRHMRLALYGSYKLRLEAQRKGVDWHLVETALVKNELDWYELAYQCLCKKYSAADLSDYKTRVKANGFLGRRGFETAEREYALARLARGE